VPALCRNVLRNSPLTAKHGHNFAQSGLECKQFVARWKIFFLRSVSFSPSGALSRSPREAGAS
jgi:hypothetical protein